MRRMARIVHIFTFRAFPAVAHGVPLSEAYDFGRFTPHLVDRPGDSVRVTRLGHHPALRVTTDRSTLAPLDITAHLWWDDASLAQLHLSYELDSPSAREVANHVAIFCHERTSLSLDGSSLVDWVTAQADLDRAPRLDQDVLQLVELDDAAGLVTNDSESRRAAVRRRPGTARASDGGEAAARIARGGWTPGHRSIDGGHGDLVFGKYLQHFCQALVAQCCTGSGEQLPPHRDRASHQAAQAAVQGSPSPTYTTTWADKSISQG